MTQSCPLWLSPTPQCRSSPRPHGAFSCHVSLVSLSLEQSLSFFVSCDLVMFRLQSPPCEIEWPSLWIWCSAMAGFCSASPPAPCIGEACFPHGTRSHVGHTLFSLLSLVMGTLIPWSGVVRYHHSVSLRFCLVTDGQSVGKYFKTTPLPLVITIPLLGLVPTEDFCLC